MEKVEGKDVLLINCPLGISKSPLFLIPQVAPLVASLDGELSIAQLTQKFSLYGITETLLQELVTLLDDHLFLNSEHFNRAKIAFLSAYAAETHRPPALAGLSYPSDRSSLSSLVDSYLSNGIIAQSASLQSQKLVTFMAPHIDYGRGGTCYGSSYRHLKGATQDVVIVIGTSHQYSTHLFHLTCKHFDSPLGRLETDVEFVIALSSKYGSLRSFADEILHRKEHSLELQVPFMQRTCKGKIVPVLVGSFHHMVTAGKLPSSYEDYDRFADALTETISTWQARGSRIAFVAGVDMAHIGQQFGDNELLSPEFMENIRTRDTQYLMALESRNKKALFEHIAEDGDKRRICGFPTMYTVLDIMDRLKLSTDSVVFGYEQSVDKDRVCGVTFAGMGFYTKVTPHASF